jgi:hypothetical protein
VAELEKPLLETTSVDELEVHSAPGAERGDVVGVIRISVHPEEWQTPPCKGGEYLPKLLIVLIRVERGMGQSGSSRYRDIPARSRSESVYRMPQVAWGESRVGRLGAIQCTGDPEFPTRSATLENFRLNSVAAGSSGCPGLKPAHLW